MVLLHTLRGDHRADGKLLVGSRVGIQLDGPVGGTVAEEVPDSPTVERLARQGRQAEVRGKREAPLWWHGVCTYVGECAFVVGVPDSDWREDPRLITGDVVATVQAGPAFQSLGCEAERLGVRQGE